MEASAPTTSKKKNRTLKSVTVLCSNCKRPFTTKARAHLCHNCRPQPKQPAVSPQAHQQQPKPQRPRPNRPKKPPQQQQQTAQSLVAAEAKMMRMALQNPASRLANRTSQGAALLRPNRGARSAIERLLLQTLDPAAACGQRAIRVNVDQIQLPKYPIQFDNNFVLSSTSGIYKIMLIASPIISAVVFSTTNDVTIAPARVLMFQNDSGYFYYVLNSKIGFLAEVDDRVSVTAKEDFRRFRMISASMQSQWAGPELFKNGVAVTARLTDKENMATFDPNSKVDNVISNISDVLVTTCQHSEPVFEFQPVDANNDDGGGNLPDPDKSQFAKYCYEIQSNSSGPYSGFIQPGVSVNNSTAATVAGTLALWLNGIQASMSTDANTIRLSQDIVSALSSKYKNFRSTGLTTTVTTYSCQVKVAVTMHGTSTPIKLTQTVSFNQMTNTTDGDFFRQIVIRAQGSITDTTVVPSFGQLCIGTVNIEIQVPIDGGVDQRIAVPWPIAPALSNNEMTGTPFYDDNFLQPVTSVLGTGAFNITMQYQTSHVFEFVLGDTTVLATEAVANTPTDPESVIPKGVFNRFQKIMKGMPPGHIMTDTGMTRTTMAQFASRGIINDIFSIAAPIAGALFPGIKPILTAAKPLVTAIDGAL